MFYGHLNVKLVIRCVIYSPFPQSKSDRDSDVTIAIAIAIAQWERAIKHTGLHCCEKNRIWQ